MKGRREKKGKRKWLQCYMGKERKEKERGVEKGKVMNEKVWKKGWEKGNVEKD